MTASSGPRFRPAVPGDAGAVASLHADSWRRHYRGAYSDAYLDGDVAADRLSVWSARLQDPDPRLRTVLAVLDDALVGFAHLVLDDDPTRGSLLDNLHVVASGQRRGVGSRLLALVARAAAEEADAPGLYLWVLEQNRDAQAFYEARGGRRAESREVSGPGGRPERLSGSPRALRVVWPDARSLLVS